MKNHSKRLRVLIADDEPLGRERLRRFLLEEGGVEIVAECRTGREALQQIREASPELAFLDVRMPEMDGFDVLEQSNGARLPIIVFVTAHDRFAVRAFEVNAVDYLLKPFDRGRFRLAFGRAVERLRSLETGVTAGSTAEARPQPIQRLAIKSQGRISLVHIAEIDWITAADNYVEMHVSKTTHLVRMTLKDVESQLPNQNFIRISRSHIVNLERVKEIRSRSHGDALVVLRDGTSLPASRIYLREVRPLMSSSR